MKRIHRFEVSVLENGVVIDSFKWTRGSEIIPNIYKKLSFLWIFQNLISYKEFLSMVQDCRDNSNILYVVDKECDIRVRHWSYNRKS